ncbi:hypothetical protein [Corallococcus aberystwythensis]|uniref:NACHT domain-containing protein n=1 Tax=Corallococcus aberystwythensis TaxID=2316722 RepID=A0A3A8PMH2_9BACT|nr:hypothetical protein [Corallococcus aberystwythensis]RKH56420.1 hypothetical protein D7W81_33900 [Corallococcus aberystwythensis]
MIHQVDFRAGDQGQPLGKTLFIKYLMHGSDRLSVFLSAESCRNGVVEAIQSKLEGHAKDIAFLQSIIYSGALDIYIDGLNEVAADTRARIVHFVERNYQGNILIATQRLEWVPPATARLYVLQPLPEAAIEQFLVSREPLHSDAQHLRGAEYREACREFVRRSLHSSEPDELRRAMAEILSNPMDLSVIAQMLAERQTPDLFRLRWQQYETMASSYREIYLSQFPLTSFSEEAYQMRLNGSPSLPEERFGKEILRLESCRMVVRRQWAGPDGKERREWHFRHDKIQEFFIAQTFLGVKNTRVSAHVGDPRFRGVYFMLVALLEHDEARQLRDMLVEHAAESRDHSVSDDFVNLLKARQVVEAAILARMLPVSVLK